MRTALAGVDSEEKVVPVSELKKLEERIKRLERLLGQKTEEVEVFSCSPQPPQNGATALLLPYAAAQRSTR